MLHVVLTTTLLLVGSLTGSTPALPAVERPLGNPFHLHPGEILQETTATRWVLIPEESEARYRVREQLAGFDFPNDAVGTTKEIAGTIVVLPDGSIAAEESEFRVQLASLATDNQRRDGYVRGRTLEAEQFPEAVLIPRRFVNLEHPFPTSGSREFQIEADLTLHGHTRTTTWAVTADFDADGIRGVATTAFTFDTFQIAIPQVARVLSVDDNIRLELEFRMVREGI